MTVVIFILVLAVLIFVHELGHFLAARACGIRVDAFKLGFGPKVVSWKRGETEYGVNWIPFGGYVKIFGENPDEESTSGLDAARSFVHKPRWQQAIVLTAGVLFNFIFAWALYAGVFAAGVTAAPEGFDRYAARFTDPRVMITSVLSDSPAERAGLEDGDVIRGVGALGSPEEQAHIKIAAIQAAIDSGLGQPVPIWYARKGVLHEAQIAPVQGLVEGKYAIGISMSDVVDFRLPFFAAVKEGFMYTIGLIRETVIGLYHFVADILHGSPDFSAVSGPIGIAGIVGTAASMGITYLLMVTAIISVNLGVVNLMPFPALDGGRLLFVVLEGIFRRRIPAIFTNIVNIIGFALLMILMLAVTFKDVVKLLR